MQTRLLGNDCACQHWIAPDPKTVRERFLAMLDMLVLLQASTNCCALTIAVLQQLCQQAHRRQGQQAQLRQFGVHNVLLPSWMRPNNPACRSGTVKYR
jgi:hypothetical protein